MQLISFKRHRFPPEVIRYALWAYFRFTMSLRNVEDLLAESGIHVSYEAIRCWTTKFGPAIAWNIRGARQKPTGRWHLDEMFVKIGGERMWLWRAVDDEGEVLMLVQKHRNAEAALQLMRKPLRNQGVRLETIVTDGLKSYGAAMKTLTLTAVHRHGRLRDNNRVKGSHLPIRRRERKQQRFKSQGSAQCFLATHAGVYNCFNTQRHLVSRPTLRLFRAAAHSSWAAATVAA